MDSIFVYNLEEVDRVAAYIVKLMGKYKFFLLTGSLGAGKTTLVKSILRQVGVNTTIASPTFAYVISYKNLMRQNFHHFDLYRLHDLKSFVDMGFADLTSEPNSFYFIEWPEIIDTILPKELVCRINIDYVDEQKRNLSLIFEN